MAFLPASAFAPALFARSAGTCGSRLPGWLASASALLGLSARRKLPAWSGVRFAALTQGAIGRMREGREVVLLVDTFTTWFEPETAEAARRVLRAGAGYRVHLPRAAEADGRCAADGRFSRQDSSRQARVEARALLDALRPWVGGAGVPIVGLEPSCLLTLRDELTAMLPGPASQRLAAAALLFEEFVDREAAAGRFALSLHSLPAGPRASAWPLSPEGLWGDAQCLPCPGARPGTRRRLGAGQLLRHGRHVRVPGSVFRGLHGHG